MTFSLSGLDIYFLLKEVRPLLEEAFVDKVYQGKEEKGDFLLKMRSPRSGKQQFYVKVPDAAFLTEHRFSWPQNPPGFCMQLRKHLSSAQLKSIAQRGFDRVVEITFQKGPVTWLLVVELFSKGNIVLVNEEGLIRGVLDLQRWKDRTLRVNAPYEYPPESLDLASLSPESLAALFQESGKELVKFCATVLGLGGRYAEELVARSGLEKSARQLDAAAFANLYTHLNALLEQPLDPCVLDGVAAPFPLVGWEGFERKESFSAAIEELIVTEKVEALEAADERAGRKETDKFQRIIDEQSAALAGYERFAAENQRKGEFMYEKYQELSPLFATLKSLLDAQGWSAVREFIKVQNLPITVDEKNASIAFEVKDAA